MTIFDAAHPFDLEIMGVLQGDILPISRNIGGAIAPPVPAHLTLKFILTDSQGIERSLNMIVKNIN